jgi:regulator of replication initiation timing
LSEIENLRKELLQKIEELKEEVKKLKEEIERLRSAPANMRERLYTPVVPPRKAKSPRVPLESMPFPRRLASSEIEAFYNAFVYRM